MLHRRRERLRQLAEQEAEGEDFWTSEFSAEVRVKITLAFEDASGSNVNEIADISRGLILRDEGLQFLYQPRYSGYNDLVGYLSRCGSDMVPTVIEAVHIGLSYGQYISPGAPGQFQKIVRTALREHRVKFDLADGQIVPLESLTMHTNVVEPVLVLLRQHDQFAEVNLSFRAALTEISDGNGADAITDAGTALQGMLTELGCTGNALGPLIKSAKSNKLLASHDGPMLDAIERVAHWVSADRSERGDAHKVSAASLEDAWLMVHVVGALILRLGEGGTRAT